MKIDDFLKGEFKYDNYGQYIWLVKPDGNMQKIADLRGWGAIQNLFKDKAGKIDMDEAGKFQDEIGQWIADALNEKLNKSKMKELFEKVYIKSAADLPKNGDEWYYGHTTNTNEILRLRDTEHSDWDYIDWYLCALG
jgi:hypothetical protein